MESYILLIDCKDQKGLIFAITKVLYDKNFNIISNSEFVDKSKNHFFMRTEFTGKLNKQEILDELKSLLPLNSQIKLVEKEKKNIVVLATKEHHCLGDLLIRNHYGEFNANIQAVVSNYENLRDLTNKFQVPFHFISHLEISRSEHEAALLKVINGYQPELLVLAKYMRVLSPEFISKFSNKIINIHHSFLPAFVGASPYNQAYERGVKIIGATAHFVNEHLDEGPIIAQNVIPVDHSHSAAEMAQSGRDIEKMVLAKSLKLVLDEKVFVSGNKTIIFD